MLGPAASLAPRLLQRGSCLVRPALHHHRHAARARHRGVLVQQRCSSTEATQVAPGQPAAEPQLAALAREGGGQQQQQQPGDSSSPDKKKVKRHMALHIGYVGTKYTGLQANRQLPQLATVEGVLEQAILSAGMITAANFGDFRKTKWTRSSRTDKGVHSLATVVGLKVLIDDDQDYEEDPEGIKYARLINKHLPEDVCVFAVQRTNKSFNARRWCGSRTYEYYLPASLLGLDTPNGSSPEDQARLALLRDVLQAYCGYKPYHNYAGNRSQYVGQKDKAKRRKERREARAAAEASSSTLSSTEEPDAGAAADQQPSSSSSSSSSSTSPAAPDSAADAAQLQGSTASSTASSTDAEEGEEPEGDTAAEAALYAAAAAAFTGEGPVPPELQWRQQVRFLEAPDPADPIVKSHYRMMRSFTADDPKPLVPGGVPCLRLEVCGDSFMLHQIRHMVGAAVAIVRGIMLRELLEVSLSAPGRVTLPRAPPHSLLLFGCTFSPFPAGWGLDTPLVARYTGDRLTLRERGRQMREDFRQRVFNKAINDLLQHPDWEVWSKQMLPRYTYEGMHVAVSEHGAWLAALKAKRAAAAARAEAAAAAGAVDAAAAAQAGESA